LRRLRKKCRLSQEAFALKAGLSLKYYQRIEAADKRDLRLSTLRKIAKGHRIELSNLLCASARISFKKLPKEGTTKRKLQQKSVCAAPPPAREKEPARQIELTPQEAIAFEELIARQRAIDQEKELAL